MFHWLHPIFLFFFISSFLWSGESIHLEQILQADFDTIRRVTPSEHWMKPLDKIWTWNVLDQTDPRWRPQGISGFKSSGKDYILVSWYDRAKRSKVNLGVRISLWDKGERYQHILLLDQSLEPLAGLHAGGVSVRGKELWVSDSRQNQYQFLIFDLDSVQKSTANLARRFPDYHYFWKLKRKVASPIKPSFVSYTKAYNSLLLGSFSRQVKAPWVLWDSLGKVRHCELPIADVQGALLTNRYLLLSQSWGRVSDSHLRLYPWGKAVSECPQPRSTIQWSFPPGLQDLYSDGKFLWLLTEFSPSESIPFFTKNRRYLLKMPMP